MAAPMAKHAGFFRGHNFAHIRNFLSSTGRGKWQWLHLSSSSRVAASYGQRNGGDRPDIAGPGVDRSDSRGGAPCEDRGSGHGGRDAVSPGEGGSPGNAPPEDRVNRLRKSQLQAMRRNMRLKYGIDTENTLQNTLTDLQDDMPTHSDSVRTGNLTVGAGQSKATSRQRKSHSVSETAAEDDFFGILEEETDSLSQHTANQKGIGTKKSGLGKSALYEKFRFLDKYQNEDVEQVIEMPYGLIRRDQDNIPKKHGHIYARKGIFKDMEQESMKLKLVMTADSTQNENEADDRQNMTKDDTGKHASIRHNHKDRSDLTTPVTLDFHGSSYIEDQFFSYESLDGASSSGTKPGDRTDSRKLNEDTLKEPAISSGSEFPAGAPENHSNAFMDSIQSSTNSAGPKSVFSEQYLHIDKDNISEDLSHKSPEQRGVSLRASVDAESSKLKPESSLFDEQYFGINEQAMDMEEEFPHSLTSICDSPKTSVPDIENTMVTNPFEEQYFEKTLGDEISFSSDDSVETLVAPPFVDNRYADNEHVSQARSENVFEMYGQSAVDTEVNHSRQVSGEKVEDVDSFGDMVENLNTSTDVNHYIETVTKQQERLRNHPKPDLENPQSAYDVAMKIRLEQKGKLKSAQTVQHILPPNLAKWTGAVDSKGFRKLKDQVLDIQNLQEEVVIKILKNSIIYENDDIVALDKPYGLPSHGGPGVHHSVGKLCGKLGQILDKKLEVGSLKLVHRLDKETTGMTQSAKLHLICLQFLCLIRNAHTQSCHESSPHLFPATS